MDAVLVGTWPDLHCPVTLAALRAGKHALTEARMAMDAREARDMWFCAREHPHLVTQVVPAPHTLRFDNTIQDLLTDGFIGETIGLDVEISDPRFTDHSFADFDLPMHWRHDRRVSGLNIMSVGIWYEAVMRWVGPATSVHALAKTVVRRRMTDEGISRTMEIPDHVEILADMACGATAHLRISNVTGLSGPNRIQLWGTLGTLELDLAQLRLSGGRRGDSRLRELEVPIDRSEGWRVEEEFIAAIRGGAPPSLTDFETGLRYMEFTEAVNRSIATGRPVVIPLFN